MPITPQDPPRASSERPQPAQSRRGPKEPVADAPADNFIEFGDPPSGPTGGTARENSVGVVDRPARKGRPRPQRAAEPTREAPARTAAHSLRVPDSVQERFIQIGNKWHFPDGTEAFTHQHNRLTTRSENAVVIQSMVAIAREQGAERVTVGGTEFFKKEAWFAASLAGLEVRGYKPTEFERERLVRALAARRAPDSALQAPAGEASDAPQPTSAPRNEERRPPRAGELIVGRLVDHGPAPYGHDPKQQMSYFVRIETDRGDREVWGVDLERAFRQSLSTPGIGDEVGLRAIGQEPVTVLAATRDAQGRTVGAKPFEAHRNQWVVERKDFLDERRKIAEVLRDTKVAPEDAIQRHPELEGSYLLLQLGNALADQQYGGKVQRAQFVEHLRAHLAERVENGLPLESVPLRGAEERTVPPRSPDRDYHPTR